MTDSPVQYHRREVGKLYNPARTRWSDDTCEVRLTRNGCEIVLFYSRPTISEVGDFRAEGSRFGWVDLGPAAILAFKIGDLPYMDGTFHPMRQKPEERGIPRLEDQPRETTLEALAAIDEPGSKDAIVVIGATDSENSLGNHVLVYLTFVDSATGIIVALRGVTWPPRFTYEVRATVERMMLEPYDEVAEASAIASALRLTSRDLYQTAKIRCNGGEPE